MQVKSVLVALGAIATLTLGNGDVTAAKSETNTEKDDKKTVKSHYC